MFNSSKLREEFKNAIITGNVRFVTNIIKDFEFIPFFVNNNQEFVSVAYNYRKLDIAEALISNGALFNVQVLFQINNFSCDYVNSLNQHLKRIELFVDNIQYKASTNLVDAYGCNSLLSKVIAKSNYNHIDITQYMTDHTVSNNKGYIFQYYKNLISDSGPLSLDVIKAVVGISYNVSTPFIIMPVGTRTYFNSINIKTEQAELIYLPVNDNDKSERSFTSHELTHYVLNGLKDFNGCAFYDQISQKAYNKAGKGIISNLFSRFADTTKLNINNLINDEQLSVKDMGVAVVTNSNINLELFLHLVNPDDDLLIELLIDKHITKDHAFPIINKKILLDNYIESYMMQKNITQQEGYLIARIFEFLLRSDDQLCSELLVRIPELEAYGLDPSEMNKLNPLREYWTQYISPKIHEVINTLPISFYDQIQSSKVTSSGNMLTAEVQQNITTTGNIVAFDQEL